METAEKLAALAKAAQALNRAGAVWALGGSALMYFRQLVEDFHDFDLLVAPQSMAAARTALLSAGARSRPAPPPNPAFATACFETYTLDGAEFDILCDLAVQRKETLCRYPFDADRIDGTADEQGARIPLCPLADWFVLYLLMPARAKKAVLISRHLMAHPSGSDRYWLNRWLCNRLPGDVRERVLALYHCLGDSGR